MWEESMREKKGSRMIPRILTCVVGYMVVPVPLRWGPIEKGWIWARRSQSWFWACCIWRAYVMSKGRWPVGSWLIGLQGSRERSGLDRLESHQHLVSNWTHRTGWGPPRRRLVYLEEDRPEVPCVGSGPWNRSKWDMMPNCSIDWLLVRSQALNSMALGHFLTFVVCCGALFSEWYHYW